MKTVIFKWNPSFSLLDAQTLKQHIPDFEWDRGHSGLVLTPEQAEVLERLWTDYLNKHKAEFQEKAVRYKSENDRVFWDIDE